MTNRQDQPPWQANSARFEALLDKLVAIQMDLDPVCGVGKERAQLDATLESIAEACDVLSSAIADLRNIIGQVNGLAARPESLYG